MKRLVDLLLAVPGALVTLPLTALLILASTLDTRAPGLYRQHRIGRSGRPFTVVKIRSMRPAVGPQTTVTVLADSRITPFGAFLRRWKLDELPQLFLVIAGQMSLVGPRPDVAGYADQLDGDDREILELRPGVTGPASLVFRDEERFLSTFADPIEANDAIVWPAKVRINKAYGRSASVRDDIELIWLTLRPNEQRLFELLTSWDPNLAEIDLVAQLPNATGAPT